MWRWWGRIIGVRVREGLWLRAIPSGIIGSYGESANRGVKDRESSVRLSMVDLFVSARLRVVVVKRRF